MLAEPRYKQKWTEDPRNVTWSKDTSKYGYKLLSKMGWTEGKGLGANENGEVNHVKVSKRRENLGLGAKTNHEDNWISHQDEFSALLSKLNQKGEKGESDESQKSLQNSVQQSQRKILYSKFIKSKDLSLKSKNDLACVFGQRSQSTPATPQDMSEDEGAKSDTSTASCPVESHKNEHGIVTVKSEMNLQEYFAQRMAALKAKNEQKGKEEKPEKGVDSLDVVGFEDIKIKKKMKDKKRKTDKEEVSSDKGQDVDIVSDVLNGKELKENKQERRKKKKTRNDQTIENEKNEGANEILGFEICGSSKVKQKTKTKGVDSASVENEIPGESKLRESKSKKDRKYKDAEIKDNKGKIFYCKERDGDVIQDVKTKSKKRKKSKRAENENEMEVDREQVTNDSQRTDDRIDDCQENLQSVEKFSNRKKSKKSKKKKETGEESEKALTDKEEGSSKRKKKNNKRRHKDVETKEETAVKVKKSKKK